MRDLTVDEIEMVNGGDAWGEIQQAVGGAWNSFWSWVGTQNPMQTPTPTQQQVEAIRDICGGNPQSVTFSNGGASFTLNGATKSGTVTISGGTMTVNCPVT